MGNVSYIIPTINVEDYTHVKIGELLTNKFPYFDIECDNEFSSIRVSIKDKSHICNLYFEQECYILDFEQDIKDLNESGDTYSAIQLEMLKENIKIDLNNTLEMTYGNAPYSYRTEIESFLHSHFRAFIFDEGIHPEFIPPDYRYKNIKDDIQGIVRDKFWKSLYIITSKIYR